MNINSRNIKGKIVDEFLMFKKEITDDVGLEQTVYRSNMYQLLKESKVNLYKGFPIRKGATGFKKVSDFINARTRRHTQTIPKEVLLDSSNNLYVEFDKYFEVYLVGYENKISGGNHVKVFITNNHQDYYLIDMYEEDLYEFLTTTDIDNKVNGQGQLNGGFVMYQHASGLKPISEFDGRLK